MKTTTTTTSRGELQKLNCKQVVVERRHQQHHHERRRGFDDNSRTHYEEFELKTRTYFRASWFVASTATAAEATKANRNQWQKRRPKHQFGGQNNKCNIPPQLLSVAESRQQLHVSHWRASPPTAIGQQQQQQQQTISITEVVQPEKEEKADQVTNDIEDSSSSSTCASGSELLPVTTVEEDSVALVGSEEEKKQQQQIDRLSCNSYVMVEQVCVHQESYNSGDEMANGQLQLQQQQAGDSLAPFSSQTTHTMSSSSSSSSSNTRDTSKLQLQFSAANYRTIVGGKPAMSSSASKIKTRAKLKRMALNLVCRRRGSQQQQQQQQQQHLQTTSAASLMTTTHTTTTTTTSSSSSSSSGKSGRHFMVMISYVQAEGRDYALSLKRQLESLGLSVYLDLHEIKMGSDWQDSLNEGVLNCQVFIPLVTPSYGRTLWTGRELKLADISSKLIIPINFGQSWPPSSLAIQFATKQYISWLAPNNLDPNSRPLMRPFKISTNRRTGELKMPHWQTECVENVANHIKQSIDQFVRKSIDAANNQSSIGGECYCSCCPHHSSNNNNNYNKSYQDSGYFSSPTVFFASSGSTENSPPIYVEGHYQEHERMIQDYGTIERNNCNRSKRKNTSSRSSSSSSNGSSSISSQLTTSSAISCAHCGSSKINNSLSSSKDDEEDDDEENEDTSPIISNARDSENQLNVNVNVNEEFVIVNKRELELELENNCECSPKLKPLANNDLDEMTTTTTTNKTPQTTKKKRTRFSLRAAKVFNKVKRRFIV